MRLRPTARAYHGTDPRVIELPPERAAPLIAEGMREDPVFADAVRGERRKIYVQEIQRFVETRRLDRDAWVKRQELGKAKDRLPLIKRAIIDNVSEFYRQNPHADLTVGVLVIDSLFADNDDGYSNISAARMAKLLSCDERSIRRCRDRLYDATLLDRERQQGLGDRYWPVINRFLLGANVHPTTWLDATSKPPAPER